MPDKNGLLTEAEIGAILAETGFPDEEVSYKHKAGVVSTINVYPLLREAIRVYHAHLAGMSDEDMLLTGQRYCELHCGQPFCVEHRVDQSYFCDGPQEYVLGAKEQLAKAIPILRAKWEKEIMEAK